MILYVDLTTKKIHRAEIADDVLRLYLGGSGFNTRLLYDLAPTRVAPLAAQNPLILSIGPMVQAGIPTAARASFTSTGPLTGLFCDSSSGGSLGLRLAALKVSHVVIQGKAGQPSVLVIGKNAEVAIEPAKDLWRLDPQATDQLLQRRYGNCETARIGRGGENAVRFAGIISSRNRSSMSGRGGLGAVMGSKNLKAIVIASPPPPAKREECKDLVTALMTSTRLEMRAQRGTLDLLQSYSAMQDLREKNFSQTIHDVENFDVEKIHAKHAKGKTGCSGCPTPCGVRYESVDLTKGMRAEFGAVYALGVNLGIQDFSQVLKLLEAADRLGLDAIEMGVVLGIYAVAQEKGLLPQEKINAFRNPEHCLHLMECTAQRQGIGDWLANGSAWFAQQIGAPDLAPHAKGQAGRPEKNLAAILGQAVSTRGGDHMRAFPFLLFGGAERKLLEQWVGPFSSEAAFDLQSPVDKGRIVRWHENFKTAVDASGFCVFSAAALLCDRLMELDQLSALMPVNPPMDFAEFFQAGERIVQLQRAFNWRRGARQQDDMPHWSAGELCKPGMLDDYYSARRLMPDGRPSRQRLQELGLHDIAADLENKDLVRNETTAYVRGI